MSYWEHIGKMIKHRRENIHLTQQDLADGIGTSKSYISDLENGRKKTSLDRLVEVAEELECHLDIKMNSN